jgi:hypothetical protein
VNSALNLRECWETIEWPNNWWPLE